MNSQVMLREFQSTDAQAINALGVAAFEQYAPAYGNWPHFKSQIASMASMAEQGEMVVAMGQTGVVGAVTYIAPHRPKSSFFAPQWAVMRMLVVAPEARGQGVGRALLQACLDRAQRDHASIMGLHTSPIMTVALQMYLKWGFRFEQEAPPIQGVPYNIYVKRLFLH